MTKSILPKITAIILLVITVSSFQKLSGQDTSAYYPAGDPHKWNVELTPFFWIPWVAGTITSTYMAQNFDVPAIDLLKNIEMGFMITAEVSKGKFFASPTYIYNRLGSDKVVRTDYKGEDALVSAQNLKMNVAELIAGIKLPLHKKFILDSYIGCRYNNFHTTIEAEGKLDTTSLGETTEFWDPVIGIGLNYFPHPRVPLSLRADIGGFDVGSRLSWTTTLTGGYSLSRVVDLLAGFNAYGFDYAGDTEKGKPVGLDAIFYGFDIGIRFHIPGRAKDPKVFNKFES
jgi:hypothetical protein